MLAFIFVGFIVVVVEISALLVCLRGDRSFYCLSYKFIQSHMHECFLWVIAFADAVFALRV